MVKITIPARTDCLDDLISFLDAQMEGTRMSPKHQNHVRIAAEEIFVNIARYAYPTGAGDVWVRTVCGEQGLVVEFRDGGVAFDPLLQADPDTQAPLDEREIGGLGIFMAKKLMDRVDYRYEDNQNILTMEKFF